MKIEARSICTHDPEELDNSFSGTPWDRGLGFFQQFLYTPPAHATDSPARLRASQARRMIGGRTPMEDSTPS